MAHAQGQVKQGNVPLCCVCIQLRTWPPPSTPPCNYTRLLFKATTPSPPYARETRRQNEVSEEERKRVIAIEEIKERRDGGLPCRAAQQPVATWSKALHLAYNRLVQRLFSFRRLSLFLSLARSLLALVSLPFLSESVLSLLSLALRWGANRLRCRPLLPFPPSAD